MVLAGCTGAERQGFVGAYRGTLTFGKPVPGRLRLLSDGRADFSSEDRELVAAGKWQYEAGLLSVEWRGVETVAGRRSRSRFSGSARRSSTGFRWSGGEWRRL